MKYLAAIAILAFPAAALAQSHGHIYAGAIDSNASGGINAGDRLSMYFEPGTQLTTLAYNAGANTYGANGYSWNGYTTFAALHQSSFPDETPNYNNLGALSGSFIRLDLVSVSGPGGARLAFYEPGNTDPAWVWQVGVGLLDGDGEIPLTEQSWFDGSPEDEISSGPYGHVHGRMFAVDTAGEYTATWILRDRESSVTGLLDSQPFTSSFTAAPVPEPAAWALLIAAALLLIRKLKPSAAPGRATPWLPPPCCAAPRRSRASRAS